MPRHRDIGLTPEEQRAYLEDSHTAILTSLDRHGYPHSVAMWYVLDPDGTAVMTTFAKSQKAVNLRRDPRCSFLIESGRTYPELKGLLIRGRASLDTDVERIVEVLERINWKYNRLEIGQVREALIAQARKRTAIRIHPVRVSSWDHAKLMGAY